DHELLGGSMVGGGGRFKFKILGDRVSARLGYEYLAGNADRMGIPCAGLIEPGQCQTPEPLVDHGRLASGSFGAGVRTFSRNGFSIDLVSDYRIAWVNVDTRSLSSDRKLSANKQLMGMEFGVEAMYTPFPFIPVS